MCALHGEGINAVTVDRGRAALSHFNKVDLVLLKLQLPDINGFELCQLIRLSSQVPIIMVSGHDDEFDCVLGLKVGADDYVVRPYRLHELLARMEAVVRRATGQWPVNLADSVRNVGALRLDLRLRRVVVEGTEIALTRKEFDLLAFLASDPGRTFTREGIMSEVWGHNGTGDTRTLGVHMAGLRRKLGVGNLIETVWGVGFRLVETQHRRQHAVDLAQNVTRLPCPDLPLEVQFQHALAVADQAGTASRATHQIR
jgi:two-component system response regulator RegX3